MTRSITAWAVALAAVLADPAARGADAAAGDVVTRVGASEPITASELERRIAAMPVFQRTSYGSTPEAIRRRVLDEVLVRERLLDLAAQTGRIEGDPAVGYALDRARAMATVRAVRARAAAPSAIPASDVRAYFDANRSRYESPERMHLWRILSKTREDAQAVLDACKGTVTPKVFSDLARDRSEDKATSLRGGDLGFIAEDGTSTFPEVRVDPALYRAAAKVEDGAVVPAVVPEGSGFSVVWRRGTLPGVHRSIEEVAASIRDALARDRVHDETERLVASLRASKLRDLDAAPLEELDLDAGVP